jgi:hypothetical protein
MIIYGTRNKKLESIFPNNKCAHCNNVNTLEMHIFQKYAHVFWLPFFPLQKHGISQCNHCKQVLTNKQMPPALQEVFNETKKTSKTPIWLYTGAALLIFGIFSIIFSAQQENKRSKAYLLNPKEGDLYEIKKDNNYYTIYKAVMAKGDSVFVQESNYETKSTFNLREIKDSDYNPTIFILSKKELLQNLENGKLLKVERQ